MKPNNGLEKSDFIVRSDASIEDAMKVITANRLSTAIIIDSERHVVGVTTDGIIRRAMLKGAIMQTPVTNAMDYNPLVIKADDKETLGHIGKFLEEHPRRYIFPIIDKNNVLIDVIVNEEPK